MLEFGLVLLVSAIMMTLVTDTMSGAAKMLRATRRREKNQVAQEH